MSLNPIRLLEAHSSKLAACFSPTVRSVPNLVTNLPLLYHRRRARIEDERGRAHDREETPIKDRQVRCRESDFRHIRGSPSLTVRERLGRKDPRTDTGEVSRE